jgi:hypothetical protein
MVTFWPEGNKNPTAAAVDPTGRFQLRCAPGEYKVTVAPLGGGMIGVPPPGAQVPPGVLERMQSVPPKYSRVELTDIVVTISPAGGDDLNIPLNDK